MAKGMYVGVNNVARKVKKAYIGVNGVARKVKKIYVGVNGVARLAYSGREGVILTIRATGSASGTLSAYTPEHQLIGNYTLTSNEAVYITKYSSAWPTNCWVLGFIGEHFYLFSYYTGPGQYVAKIAQFKLNDNGISLVRVVHFQPHSGVTKEGALRMGATIINNHIILGTCANYDEVSVSYRNSTGCYKYDANLNLVKQNQLENNLNGGFAWAGDYVDGNNEFVAYRYFSGAYSTKVAINFDTLVSRNLGSQEYYQPVITAPSLPSGKNFYSRGNLSGTTHQHGLINAAGEYNFYINYSRRISMHQVDGFVAMSSDSYYEYWTKLYKYAGEGVPFTLYCTLNGSGYYRGEYGQFAPTPTGFIIMVYSTHNYAAFDTSANLVTTVALPATGNSIFCGYFKL